VLDAVALPVDTLSRSKRHELLRKKRLDVFMAAFSVITRKLKEMYQMITLGGDAELELVDSLDPFSEGIVFRCVSVLHSR
jgi:chromosome segregation ATPase